MRLKIKTAPTCEPVTLEEAKNFLKIDIDDDDSLIYSLIVACRKHVENVTKRVLITQTWRLVLDSANSRVEIPHPPLQNVVSVRVINEAESYVDEDSADSQAVLKVAATTGFFAGDTVVVNRDGDREEWLTVLSVQDGISLTMTGNLASAHTAAQGDRVEKYTLVSKSHYSVDGRVNSFSRINLRPGYSWPVHRNFASFIVEFVAGHADDGDGVPDGLKQSMLMMIGRSYENRGSVGSVESRVHASKEAGMLLDPHTIRRI